MDTILWLDPDPAAASIDADDLVAKVLACNIGDAPVRLQCNDKKLSALIGKKLHAAGLILDPHDFVYLLSVVKVVTTTAPEPPAPAQAPAQPGAVTRDAEEGSGEGGGGGSAEGGDDGDGGGSEAAAAPAVATEAAAPPPKKKHGHHSRKPKVKPVVVETLRFGIVPAAGQ